MNWDDLRVASALAETGSIAATAQRLGCNQTTVTRRIAALESALGARLFQRDRGRRLPTAAGEVVIGHAAAIAEAADALRRQIGGESIVPRGTVRITAIESFMTGFLAPRLCNFRRMYPEITLELIGGSSNLSLSKREADIALRLATPHGAEIVARKLAEIGFAVYVAVDAQEGDFATAAWVAYDDALAHLPEAEWLSGVLKNRNPALRSNNSATLHAAIAAGLGRGVLPCYRGDGDPTLKRISGAAPIVVRTLWLVIHRDLRSIGRIRAVANWLTTEISAARARLAGMA